MATRTSYESFANFSQLAERTRATESCSAYGEIRKQLKDDGL
jgi:hypothetical protein